jgi:hypothetical protein
MTRPIKPHRWWGITYITGNDVMPDTIRRTRKQAQEAVSDQRSGGMAWSYWKKRGCRAVRVTVIVESAQ